MIKANELRVGNYFHDNTFQDLTVHGLTSESHENGGIIWYDLDLGFYLDLKEAFPIHLTEEWLLKFGFDKQEVERFIDNENYRSDHWDYISEHSTKDNYFIVRFVHDNFKDKDTGKWGSYEEVHMEFRFGSGRHNTDCVAYGSTHKFVHQLQNLYWSLMLEELTVK